MVILKIQLKTRFQIFKKKLLVGTWYERRGGLSVKIVEKNNALFGVVLYDKQSYSKKNEILFQVFYNHDHKFHFYYFYH